MADATGLSSSPLPPVTINTMPAPGQRGPVGLAPRQTFSKVNTDAPPTPDAGAMAQKSALPKTASEGSMGIAGRPTLQEMMKAAWAGAASQVQVTEEAMRQQALFKTAAEKCSRCGKEEDCKCSKDSEKEASISTDEVMKLAEACGYLADLFEKKASEVQPGTGPGALTVTETNVSAAPINPNQGQASSANVIPKDPPMDGTAMHTTINEQTKGTQKMAAPIDVIRKLAGINYEALAQAADKVKAPKVPVSAPAPKGNFGSGMNSGKISLSEFGKQAEDAINPAHISAGPASTTALETSESGQPGGAPVGGQPEGRTSLIASNEAAINYTRGQAKAPDKADMRAYHTEPMHSMAHDNTLQQAFAHTGEAGTKFASANLDDATRVAAGRALLEKLAEAASNEKRV